MPQYRQIIENIFVPLDIQINGSRPWDISVHNEKFFRRILLDGSLGLGESYMAGWWDCGDIPELIKRLITIKQTHQMGLGWQNFLFLILGTIFNYGRKSKAFEVGQRHYDLDNALFQKMLDRRMTYTCGYWQGASNLDEAQEKKLDLVCRKIGLRPGMKVLDIGCGWGSFMKFAAQNYGVNCVGVTVSKEQKILGETMCHGLPIEFKLQDYRDITGRFDRVVSIGMFEHVGHRNYRTFMKVARNALKDNGLFLLHTIGSSRSVRGTDQWIGKYIFPNSMLPSIKQIGESIERLFVMEDWHNFGVDYDKTLMAWHKNFEDNWDKIKSNYDERFYRMWRYYLLSCAGSFRVRENQLWQIVLSPAGIKGGYNSIR